MWTGTPQHFVCQILWDKYAAVEKVSYEPRLPAVQACVKRSLIPNRCCGENGARRVTGASYTLNVI